MLMKAKRTFPFAGTYQRKGDIFEASRHDARLLRMLGHAEDAPTVDTTPVPRQTTNMQAAGSNQATDTKPKRQYTRRDMTPKVGISASQQQNASQHTDSEPETSSSERDE